MGIYFRKEHIEHTRFCPFVELDRKKESDWTVEDYLRLKAGLIATDIVRLFPLKISLKHIFLLLREVVNVFFRNLEFLNFSCDRTVKIWRSSAMASTRFDRPSRRKSGTEIWKPATFRNRNFKLTRIQYSNDKMAFNWEL